MHARVVEAAHQRFRAKGYHATSVADIAGDLDVASSYIYKFFRSKNAIGEAVCAKILHDIHDTVRRMATGDGPARDKLMALFRITLQESLRMFFAERKLHDLVARSLMENWAPITLYQDRMRSVIMHILDEGLSDGSFDGSIDRTGSCEALVSALRPFAHPTILEQTINEDLDAKAEAVGQFCLRAVETRVTNF